LEDPRPAVVDGAINRLAKLGAQAIPTLTRVLKKPGASSPAVRRSAIWALCRIDGAHAREASRVSLSDPDATVRGVAIHAAGLWRDAGALTSLLPMVTSDQAAMRRRSAEALGRIGDAVAVPTLFAGIRAGGDRFLEHSLIFALIQINAPAATRPALNDP